MNILSEPPEVTTKFISFRWKILLLILTPLLLAIVSTQLILWIFLRARYQEQKNLFVKNNTEEIVNYVTKEKEKIENISTINEVSLSEKDIENNINNKSQSDLEKYFWYQMKYNPQLYQVYYASEKGEWLAIKRKPNNQLVTQYKGAETNGQFREYSLNQGGEREGGFRVIEKTNPRLRPWYKQAKESKNIGWTHAYFFEDSDQEETRNDVLGRTRYQPINNLDSNKFQGVLGIDLNLSYIIQNLSQMGTVERQARIFIMDCSFQSKTTHLIAFPNLNPPNRNHPSTDEIEEQINKLQYCQKTDKQLNEFKLNNYDIYLSPFPESSWILVITFSDKIFMNPLIILSVLILLGGVILSLLAATLSFFLSHKLSEPITIITDAAQEIQSKKLQKLNLQQLEKISKKHDEIGVLAKVFLNMIAVIYNREDSLREKIKKLEGSTKLLEQSSLSPEQEYIEQLIKTSRYIRNRDHQN